MGRNNRRKRVANEWVLYKPNLTWRHVTVRFVARFICHMGCKCMTSYYIININKYFCPNRLFVSPSYTGVSCILVTFFFFLFLCTYFSLLNFNFVLFVNLQISKLTHTHTHIHILTQRDIHTHNTFGCACLHYLLTN